MRTCTLACLTLLVILIAVPCYSATGHTFYVTLNHRPPDPVPALVEADLLATLGVHGANLEYGYRRGKIFINRELICEEEILKIINIHWLPEEPIASPYTPPEYAASVQEFEAALAALEAQFAKDENIPPLRPYAVLLRQSMEILIHALQGAYGDPGGGQGAIPADLRLKAQDLSRLVTFVAQAAGGDSVGKIRRGLEAVRKATDSLTGKAQTADPGQPAATSPKGH